MKIQAVVAFEVRDRYGQLKSYKKKEANSFVRAFIDILYAQMLSGATSSISGLDISNTSRTLKATGNSFAMSDGVGGGAGDLNVGIIAGTGTSAVALADYKIGTVIAQGAGAGQLQYGAVGLGQPTTVGSTRKFTVTRTLTNGSGADINVTELALYAVCQDTGDVNRYFCIDRTLNSFTIGSTLNATITYTISVTV